jgi:hypothetical protein
VRGHARENIGLGRRESIMAWFVYVMSPIDDRWDYLSTVEEIATKSAVEAARGKIRGYHNYGCVDPDDFAADFGSAQEIAAMHGWEGDFKQEARVFWLPEPDNLSFVYAFVWKQENNGMIFVVSPHPLPWLGNPSHLRSSRE